MALLIGWKNSLARRVHHAREFCYVRLLPRRSQITFQKTLQGSFRLTLDFFHVLCRAHLREIYLCNIYRVVYLRIFNWHYKVTGLRDLHFSNNRSTFKVIFECLWKHNWCERNPHEIRRLGRLVYGFLTAGSEKYRDSFSCKVRYTCLPSKPRRRAYP